jgi:hypothetical protein
MKLLLLVLVSLLICKCVRLQAFTTTLTYLVKTTTSTSTHQFNALCASYVSVTGPCRRRKNIWLNQNDPLLIYAYDQELKRIFI